jgi:hypothetical protein
MSKPLRTETATLRYALEFIGILLAVSLYGSYGRDLQMCPTGILTLIESGNAARSSKG